MDYLTPAQCRAARALLDWSQPDLAERCGMHVQTISAFENETGTPTKRTLSKVTETLEQGGVEFLPNEGVGRKKRNIIRYDGQEGFQAFMWDVFETVKNEGGEICVSNVDETLFTELLGRECDDEYTMKMNNLRKTHPFDFKILIRTGDTNTVASGYAEYRTIDEEYFGERSFYAYGSKLALLTLLKGNLSIVVLDEQEYTDSYRIIFNVMWDKVARPVS